MPNYRTHLVGGIACGIGTMAVTGALSHASPTAIVEYLGCAALGALFPDIDIKSKGQKLFYIALTITLLFLLWYRRTAWFVALSLLGMVPLLLRHRGIMHHPWFVGLCAGIPALYLHANNHAYSSLAINLFYFAIGAFSHIILDVGFFTFCRKVMLRR